MVAGEFLDAPELSLERIDARSGGENPRRLDSRSRAARPHLRAIYGFARLVDNLGDEAGGDRVRLLAALERELAACYGDAPDVDHGTVAGDDRSVRSATGAFERLIAANRIDQERSRYETWEDVRWYCTHSAEPVGRLVLGVYGSAGEPALVAMSDDVRTGLQLVNFLQDPPATWRSSGSTCRWRMYAGSASPSRSWLAPGRTGSVTPMRFESARAAALLRRGLPLAGALGGSRGRSVALFARGGLAALAALERAGWDVFTGRPA